MATKKTRNKEDGEADHQSDREEAGCQEANRHEGHGGQASQQEDGPA